MFCLSIRKTVQYFILLTTHQLDKIYILKISLSSRDEWVIIAMTVKLENVYVYILYMLLFFAVIYTLNQLEGSYIKRFMDAADNDKKDDCDDGDDFDCIFNRWICESSPYDGLVVRTRKRIRRNDDVWQKRLTTKEEKGNSIDACFSMTDQESSLYQSLLSLLSLFFAPHILLQTASNQYYWPTSSYSVVTSLLSRKIKGWCGNKHLYDLYYDSTTLKALCSYTRFLFLTYKKEKCQLSSRYKLMDILPYKHVVHFKLTNMYRQEALTIIVVLVMLSIDAYPHHENICFHNVIINGTNLLTNYRKQVLVIGISHLGCQACRNQAVR